MQSAQTMMYSPGANEWICKYIVKMDDNKYAAVSTDTHKRGKMRTETSYLYNT